MARMNIRNDDDDNDHLQDSLKAIQAIANGEDYTWRIDFRAMYDRLDWTTALAIWQAQNGKERNEHGPPGFDWLAR